MIIYLFVNIIHIFLHQLTGGKIKDTDNVLINTFVAFNDCRHYRPDIEELNTTLEGYIILTKDGYKLLPIPSNYVAVDFSNNIDMFAEADKGPEIKNEGLGAEHHPWVSSQDFYSYELVCGDYSYSDITYVNSDGDVIASGFEDGYGFYEGLAPACKNGKWGYIDTNGNVVVDFIFDKTTPLSNGKAWVMYKGKVGKLNIKDMIDNGTEFSNENLSQ